MLPLSEWPRLLCLSPGTLSDARAAQAYAGRVRDLVAGGLRGIVLREPELADAPLLWLAREVRALLPPSAGVVSVHDRLHVALAMEADAVHLGFRSLPLERVRAIVDERGSALRIGLSTHAADDPATWAGADYLFHGPFAEVTSKPHALPPVGVDGLKRALAARPDPKAPLFALGGIDGSSAPAALQSGVQGLAVLGALSLADDALAQLEALLVALSEAGF